MTSAAQTVPRPSGPGRSKNVAPVRGCGTPEGRHFAKGSRSPGVPRGDFRPGLPLVTGPGCSPSRAGRPPCGGLPAGRARGLAAQHRHTCAPAVVPGGRMRPGLPSAGLRTPPAGADLPAWAVAHSGTPKSRPAQTTPHERAPRRTRQPAYIPITERSQAASWCPLRAQAGRPAGLAGCSEAAIRSDRLNVVDGWEAGLGSQLESSRSVGRSARSSRLSCGCDRPENPSPGILHST